MGLPEEAVEDIQTRSPGVVVIVSVVTMVATVCSNVSRFGLVISYILYESLCMHRVTMVQIDSL